MYYVTGKVVKGDGYGKKLGFPTVNLDIRCPSEIKIGVYAGTAEFDGKKYNAGIVIGPSSKVEAHLIGFSGDLYGIEISLEIKKFLREYKKFDTEEELKEQIKKDLQVCKEVA